MLQDLPTDCLGLIVGHLPTVSSIFNLALTSRHFHHQISADNYAILRDFVQNAFPSIKASPPWREAAIRLTSRSRAWDRKAFIARECWNPSTNWNELSSASKHGFVPVIDGYETSPNDSGAERKEVLAHSAAGRVMIRVTRVASSEWQEIRFPEDNHPENDILDLQLLRPHQQLASKGETVIFRRANGEIAKVESLEGGAYEQTAEFTVPGTDVECVAVSQDKTPSLAMCGPGTLHLFPVHSKDDGTAPIASFKLQELYGLQHKRRCAKFLSENVLATGLQYLEGRSRAPIEIYDLNALPSHDGILGPLCSITSSKKDARVRHGANVLAPLDSTYHGVSNLLLSGWSDGIIRLLDIRSPQATVASYHDTVDDGQILSLLPIGHERFLAGSHQNACLKTFDFRMPGAKPHSHWSAPHPNRKVSFTHSENAASTSHNNLITDPQRDINIFLAVLVSRRPRLWFPVLHPRGQSERYRGPIYSLSSPSSSSPRVYAGITNHVIQLDFASTDDIFKGNSIDPLLHIPLSGDKDMLELSCYERPRPGHESTDPVLLRKQRRWWHMENLHTAKNKQDQEFASIVRPDAGWDERWLRPESRENRWERGCLPDRDPLSRPSRPRNSFSNAGRR